MERYIPSNDLKGIKHYTESLENSLRTTQTDGNFLTKQIVKTNFRTKYITRETFH